MIERMRKQIIPLLPLLPLLPFLALSARADILPGLEAYGDLTLVDEVNCATDTTHEFHEYTGAGPYSCGSYVTNILGSACRVLEHAEKDDLYFSYRIGKGKGLVAHDMYLLVVEYPEDVPRTATLINRAMNSRNGWHTGISVGETVVPHIVGQTHPESMSVPLSGTWNRLEQVMFLNEKVFPYDTTESYIDSEENGFDVIFSIFTKADSPDSAGVAVRSIKLYRMNDEKGLATPFRYPAGDAPKRHITWRDEMGKHNVYTCNANLFDNLRMKMRLMKELGLDTWSRDLLEFGKNQYWDVSYANRGNWYWGVDPDYWTDEIQVYKEAGIYLLPFYEYAGGHGPNGKGHDSADKSITLFRGAYGGHYNAFVAYGNGASGLSIDVTCQDPYEEFAAILDSTILRYKDDANFIGAWIRNRGSMPMSFSDRALARFCDDKGYASGSVTRDTIKGGKDERQILRQNIFSDQYKEYRKWWYGKRADWLSDMQQHLADGGLADAKVFFSGVWGEAGIELHDLQYYDTYLGSTDKWNPDTQSNVNDWHGGYFVPNIAVDNDAWKPDAGFRYPVASIPVMADSYVTYGLEVNSMTWPPDEYCHAAPRNDPETYTNRTNVAICYPYNTVYTTIPGAAATYRNASGDLFFSRHFCLYEGCGSHQRRNDDGSLVVLQDKDGNDYTPSDANNGYFTTEMDRCGRAIMLPELHALAYQDPTLIGFMQGGHLARNSTKEFRDFNEHFLSLPAVKGTVLWGGGWGVKPYTIRKYVTSDATYYAIINTSSQTFNNDWKYLSDESGTVTLYETVTGESTTLGNGYARFTLEPYQLKVYSTVAPDTPRFLVAVPSVGSTSASVPLAVTTLGGNSATLRAYVSQNADMSGATALPVSTLTSAGTNTVSFTGLAPNTTYYAAFGITNALGNGAAHVLSFTTDIPSDYPRGTMDVSATANEATISVNLSSFGDGSNSCDLYAVFTPSEPGLAVRSGLLGSRSTVGACSFPFAPLSSEATYTAELFATNSAGYGIRLAVATVTTPPRPAGFAPEYRPGLMQHKYGCTQSQHPDWSVGAYGQADADRTLGTIMADVTGNPGPEVTNPLSGKTYQWANNTTFVYEGQMWFEGGVAYNFFHNVDDGVAIELDGTMLTDLGNSSGYQTITQVSKTYAESGWHDIRVWVYDWTGNKGYGGKVGGMEYKTGLGWNTNGTTSVTAADVDKWSNLSDPGDGSLLRTRIGYGYVAAAGAPARSGSALLVPLRYRSYDEDDALVVYYRPSAIPADPFDPASWQGSAAVSPLAFPGESTASAPVSGLSLQPGDTVWLSARLSNARLGHESWSEPVSYTVPDDLSDPEFTAALDGAAGFRDAAFSVAVASVGNGAQTVTVTLAVTGGGATRDYTLAQDAASYAGTFRTPYELAYDTDYTAVVTVRNNLGRTATKTIAFRTLPPVPVAGSVAADPVGYTNTTIAATIAELGTDATRADVVFQIATDAAFSHVVRTSSGLFATASGQTVSFAAGGLADNTDYWARAQFSSDNGTSSTTEAVSFRTRRFTAPAFADGAAVVAGSANAAALTVALSALGDGSETVALAWTLAGGPADATNGTVVVAAAATPASIPFSGLAPETTYTVTLVATGANGLAAQLPPISFTTPALAVALAAPRIDLDADGANATASVEILRADAGAALCAVLDGGAPATVAENALTGTIYDFAFTVGAGDVRTVRFRLVGGAGDVVQTPVVPVRGHKRADWFTVALGEGYAAWPFSGSTGPDGGSWTLEGTPAALVSAGGAVRVALAGGEDDRVVYAPAPFDPTKADGSIRVSGRTRMFAGGAGLPTPAGAPVAGLAMRDAGGGEAVFVGWTANGWTDLVGVAAESGTDVDWTADLDFEAGTVVYRVGGLVLSDSAGTAALPAPAKASRTVDAVAFVGAGEIGDFRGWYFAADGTLVVVAPVLFGLDDDDVVGEGRPLPLSFDVNGQNVPVMRLAISLAHVEPGTHLAAFESGDLGAPDNEWVCVGGSFEVTASQKSAGYLPIELDGSAPAKFVKLVASTDPISANTTLADLGK